MKPLDDAAIQTFLDLSFDFVMTRRVSELVDVDRLLLALDTGLAPDRVMKLQSRIAAPLRTRLLARAAASSLKMAVWLPEPVAKSIGDLLGLPAPIPKNIIDEVVTSEGVRDEVREMLRDSLSNFVAKPPGGGLGSALGGAARAFGAAGKGLLGGLGDSLQQGLQDRVREFVDGSVEAMQERIAKKLAHPDTAKALGKRRKKAFLKLLDTPESKVAQTIDEVPHAAIDALVPTIVAHNLARAEIRTAIKDEVTAVITELSKQTIGELLDDLGLRDVARASLHAHGIPLGRDLAKSPAFASWYASLQS